MMAELCFHITDLVQNSAAAKASLIRIRLEDKKSTDGILLEIEDNGCGMDEKMVQQVQDPFFTTKSGKKVGLGIPLLKETAQMCGGTFQLESSPGKGTRILARLQRSHLDTPPLGDLEGTILTTIIATGGGLEGDGNNAPDIDIIVATDKGTFQLTTMDIRDQLEGVPLCDPDVIGFLRQYIHEGIITLSDGR